MSAFFLKIIILSVHKRIASMAVLNDLDLYPNPASNSVMLSYNSHEKSYITISLYSINGLNIMQLFSDESYKGNNQVEIGYSNLPAGVYFIKLQTSKEIITRKLVIQLLSYL